jgi:ribosomal protein S27AE
VWNGATNSNGVPVASHKGGLITIPKFIYKLLHGEPPPRKLVTHSCRKSLCIAPHHLEAKSFPEIHADRQKHHPKAPVVREVRELYATGNYSQQEIATMLDLEPSNVASIVRGTSWKSIGGFPEGKDKIVRRYPKRFSDTEVIRAREARKWLSCGHLLQNAFAEKNAYTCGECGQTSKPVTIRQIADDLDANYLYVSQIVNGNRRKRMACGHSFDSAAQHDDVWVCTECGKALE